MSRLVVLLASLVFTAALAHADTGSSLGDHDGEGSTAFTGLAQAPEANLFTGSLTTGIALEVPPGRGGMTPQLALQYSSGGGPGPFGHGWDLPLGRIERSSAWGTPRCTGAHTDDFVLVLPTGAAELVREASGSPYFRPKVEEAWIRAEQRAAENQWVVVDRSGRTYTFGDVDSARVATSTPATLMSQSGGRCDFTAVWALTRVEDPNGNRMEIAWSRIFNTLYPATVRWGANAAAGVPHLYVARFLPEWRPALDRQGSYRLGVATRLVWRIYEIDVELEAPAPGTPVRSYVLHYDDDGGGYQSLLAAVGVTGRPTQHFVYAPGVSGHQPIANAIARPPGAYDRLRVANDSLEVSQSVLDMNGDGILDLVRSDDAPASSWAVYWGAVDAGGGFGFQSAPIAWQAPGNWTHLRNVVVADPSCSVGWSCTQADTLDLTGDGIPDHVDASSPTSWVVHPGRGVPQWGFGAPISWPAPNLRYVRRSKNGDTYQDLVDMNGDGLPDLVGSGSPGQSAPFNWSVYLNTGTGFEATPLPAWPAPVGTIGDHVANGTGQALVDFNGDGLPDVVRSGYPGGGAWTDPRCQQSDTAYASCLEVYLNTGQGFGAMEPPIPVPQGFGVQEIGERGNVVQDLFDVNGDGLPDWIYRRFNAVTLAFDPEWRVLLNRGGTLEPVIYVPQTFLPPPYTEAIPARVWPGGAGYFRRNDEADTFVDMVDVNGDGMLDHVSTGVGGWSVQLHAATQRPNLLAVMENGLGGTNTVVYRPSTAYDNTGGDGVPDLPFIHWVVDRTRQSDGLCTPPANADPFSPFTNPCIDAGHELVTSFQYEDGRYDPLEREFRGFRRVARATNEGSTASPSLAVTVFAQDALVKGRILQVDTYAGGDTVVRRDVNLWGTRNAGGTRSQIWLSAAQRASFDLADGVPLYRTTGSDPPDGYGNITHNYSAGLFDVDRIDTFTTYAAPQSGSQVRDKPAQVRVTDASGVLQQKWYYYDGSGPDGLAGGKVMAGNLVRVRARLSPAVGNGPQTRMTYDAAGNIVTVTDDNGHVTTTTYDPYLLFPRVVTDPLGHATTTAVDYRWGQPVRIVDPNGAETAFAYDNAGRPVCAARPGDFIGQCTTETTYHFAAAAGELSWVETAARQDPPHPPLRTRHYFDALGRPRYSEASRVVDGLPTSVRSNQVDYDPAGRVGRVYDPYLADAGTPDNGSTSYDYHLNGGPRVDPLGRIHALTASDGSQRRTNYDAVRISSWDEENQRTESDLDSAGRTVERRSYDDGTLAVTVRQTYDGLGRLLALVQNGVTMRTFTYDSLGRKTRMDDADSGSWRYGYDGVGNLRWQDDPRAGQHLEICYDAGDRPTRICPLAGDFQQLQSCDTACTSPAAVTYAYDGIFVTAGAGRLARVDDGSGATEFLAYDGRGRRLDVRRTIEVDGISRAARFRYQYDDNDRVTTMTYPDGEVVRTEYDDGGQPIALYNTGGTFYVTDARYDLLGRPTLIQHANGVADTRTYGGPSQRHRLRALRSARSDAALLDLRYPRYSPRGLLQVVADDRDPSGVLSNAAVFGYDGLGRLTAADYAYNPADRGFAYDGLGNLTRNGDRVLHFDDPARPHQMTSVAVGATSTAIAHDGNGNRLGKAGQGYTYDAFDRLVRADMGANTVRFLYDYNGRQAASIREGAPAYVTRFYDQSLEVAGGFETKWYALGPLRVASAASSYTAWETASIDRGPLYVASSGLANPRLLLVLGREAQWVAVAVLLIATTALLALPGGRRRPVVGIVVRRGPATALALLCAVGTLPWPLAVAPPPALAGGGGSGTVIYHHHLDHLGSTQVITNTSGAVVQQIRYQPYGGLRGRWDGNGVSTAASATTVGREFTGFQSEAVSGLEYAGARFYDPELGSFLTHDARSQFASPYSYGGGDPLNWTDPDGDFFFALIAVILASAFASAAINTVIAAAQGLPLNAIGKAAIGGAIAGAVGAGIGVIAAAGAIGAGALAGTLSVSVDAAEEQLVSVAIRSAFSTTFANAAGQTAAAAGAPGPLVTAVSIVVGYAASYGFDQAWGDDLGGSITRDTSGQNGSKMCSNTTDHTDITTMAAEDAGFSRADVQQITQGNLVRDQNLWRNEDHFDFLAKETAGKLQSDARNINWYSPEARTEFLKAVGGATHHIQDPFALGHTVPGTSALRGPVAAPLRFLIHNAVGGEISFRQASYDATLRFLREAHDLLPGGA
ncbi:MAG TPA: toxin TcdB middle/N-terminal domain-containing protein [Candidatus Dormibacteraeota bacterium]|nr:toxin TcdB middle/N-terminal domain-containing protein [Candidatus Dormibacteraeota bacterium]